MLYILFCAFCLIFVVITLICKIIWPKIIQCTHRARIQREEKLALLEFYENTNGNEWRDNRNWLSETHLSNWKGVVLNKHDRVVKLLLARNNLKGKNSLKSITKLAEINEIDFRDNMLSGEIPQEVRELARLEGLYLYNNELSGLIPHESLGELHRLRGLYLYNNNFSDIDLAKNYLRNKLDQSCYIYI